MSKKIDSKSLVAKIERKVRESMTANEVVPLDAFRNSKKLNARPTTILVVEDDPIVRRSVVKVLEKDGYRVLSASEASELSVVLDDSAMDLIILDVGLPWVNGLELAKLLKENEELKNIPLIFISAQDGDDDIKQGFAVGADDYLTKPFQVENLRRAVKTLLQLREE